ncbi:hypothetical protein BC828DRAFT_393529, partial [Blastocladiella britannica]
MAAHSSSSLRAVWSAVLLSPDIDWHADVATDPHRAAAAARLMVDHRLISRSHALAEHGDRDSRTALAKLRSLVTGLIAGHTKAAGEQGLLVGCMLVDIWVAQAPEIVRDVGSTWTAHLMAIIGRPSHSTTLRAEAAGLLTRLLTRAALLSSDTLRDVAAPALPKLAPVLLNWAATPTERTLFAAAMDCLALIAHDTPANVRQFGDKLRAVAFAAVFAVPKHQSSGTGHRRAAPTQEQLANLAALAVTLGAKDPAAGWRTCMDQAVATMHAALNAIFAGVDEDWDDATDHGSDSRLLPSVPALTPATTAGADGWRAVDGAVHVFEGAARTAAALAATRPPSAVSVSLPARALLAVAGRVLAAPVSAPPLGDHRRAMDLAVARMPALAAVAIRDLAGTAVVGAALAAGAGAALTTVPVVPVLAAALSATPVAQQHQAVLLVPNHAPRVRAAALTVLAQMTHRVPAATLTRLLRDPLLLDAGRAGDAAAIAFVRAAVVAVGSRVPTDVRAAWDHVLLGPLVAGHASSLARHAAVVSALIPSALAAKGVAVYSTAPVVNAGLLLNAAASGDPGTWAMAATVDAMVRPRRVPDVQPVVVAQSANGFKAVVAQESFAVDGPASVAVEAVASAVASSVAGSRLPAEMSTGGDNGDDEAEDAMVVDTPAVSIADALSRPLSSAAAVATGNVAPPPPPPPVLKTAAQPHEQQHDAMDTDDLDADDDEEDFTIVDSGPDSDDA